jgi:hypothetical protein
MNDNVDVLGEPRRVAALVISKACARRFRRWPFKIPASVTDKSL